MINKIKGTLYYTNHQIIVSVLSRFFSGIHVKPRIFGFDIKLEDSYIDLYVTTTDNDEERYFVDISFTDGGYKFDSIKENFKNGILQSDILFDLSFITKDDKGNEIMPEEIFVHPDFLKRYIPPSDFS